MIHLKIKTFEDLENELEEWNNFLGEGSYDKVGILLLFKACLNNIMKNNNTDLLTDFDDFFSKEELIFLQEMGNDIN